MKSMLFCRNSDFVVREIKMPSRKVHGFVRMDEDDRANIYLNVGDSDARKKEAFVHEMIHDFDDDHYKPREIAERDIKMREESTVIEMPEDGEYVRMKRDA